MIKTISQFKEDIANTFQPVCEIDLLTLDELAFGELKTRYAENLFDDYEFLKSEDALIYFDNTFYKVNREQFDDFKLEIAKGRLFTISNLKVVETVEDIFDKLDEYPQDSIIYIHREVDKDLDCNFSQEYYILSELE